MVPDVNLKSYYLQYISDANADIIKYKESLDETKEVKEQLYDYLKPSVDIIKTAYGIDLISYDKEWINKEYNTSETLYNKIVKLINDVRADANRVILLQLVKYCNILRAEYKYNQLIFIANTRKTIKYGTYSKYVTNYYNKVHKTVLEGMGYKFGYGIGTYCINHWKIEKDKLNKTKRIDFAATNLKKKELLEKGLKPYDDKLAAWYAARNIPYDGVDYRVYKVESSFFDFTLIKSDIFTNKTLEYKRIEYINTKYRGMSYTNIADSYCKTLEDIYNLQVDIKYKLNILLYKDPNKYLNFIRNAEQCKYKRGAHNS